jgi:hypothetical protein
MSTATVTNGKPRKQLSDQLDRLDEQLDKQDAIIDALSEGLNGAVADAAREGVKEAVKAAVIEMLTDPELRTALHKATAPAAADKPTFWQRAKARIAQGAARVKETAAAVVAGVAGQVKAVRAAVTGTAGRVGFAWQMRKVLLVGLGIGLTVAAVSYVSTHGIAAALSGAGATATAVAVQSGLWVRRTVRRLTLA